jgi:predicted nuclease of predicted toxin-antitoxin system
MKILVDENIPLRTVGVLDHSGHDVRDIRGTALQGSEDAILWRLAQEEQRLLITTDRGFGRYRTEVHYGILIIRLGRPSESGIHERVIRSLNSFEESEWKRMMVVVRDVAQSVWREKTGEDS